MAITASDIQFRLSTTAGAAGDATAQADPNASLGKYVSTTELSGITLNNLFDNVTGAENAASDVEYRCMFVLNNHATLTLQNAVGYVSAEVAGGAGVAIAIATVGPVAKGSASAQAETIADESTAPTALDQVFGTPVTAGTGYALGNIAAGECVAVWVRRTAADTIAQSGDGFTLAVSGDTAA